MPSRLLPLAAVPLLLVASPASALVFGELNLLSRIGEPLRAEIPLAGDERLASDCFALAPVPNADFPALGAATLTLVSDGQQRRLLISGGPLSEPIALLSVQAACGINAQRDFLLLPPAPLASDAQTAKAVTPVTTPIRVAPPSGGGSPAPAPIRPAPRRNPAQGDRLVVGSAPSSGEHQQIEDRLLKMETTLHLLDRQIDSVDETLELRRRAIAAREGLTLATSLQTVPAAPPEPPPPPPPAPVAPETESGWLVLLLGLLGGGGVTGGLLYLLGRRKPPAARPPV